MIAWLTSCAVIVWIGAVAMTVSFFGSNCSSRPGGERLNRFGEFNL